MSMIDFFPFFLIYITDDSRIHVCGLPTVHDIMSLYTAQSTDNLHYELLLQATMNVSNGQYGMYKVKHNLKRNNMLYIYYRVVQILHTASSSYVNRKCEQFKMPDFDNIKKTFDKYFNKMASILTQASDELNKENKGKTCTGFHMQADLMNTFRAKIQQHPEFKKYFSGMRKFYEAMDIYFLSTQVDLDNLHILAEVASRAAPKSVELSNLEILAEAASRV